MSADLGLPVALVTGAGSGIGRATATMLASDGYRVVLVDRDPDALTEAAGACGPEAAAMTVDLTSPDDAQRMVESALAEFGRLDVLHNNAGFLLHRDRVEDVADADWSASMNVMLTAAFVTSRAAFGAMRAHGGGLIVHTASRAAWAALPWGVPYAAAKAGLLGLSRSLAAAGRPLGIRSNAICPGPVRTALTDGAPRSLVDRLDDEGWVTPEDVAAVVRHLVTHTDLTGLEVLVELRDGGPRYFVPEPMRFQPFEVDAVTAVDGR